MPENEGRFERGMDFFAPLPSTPHSRISLVMLRRGESGVRPVRISYLARVCPRRRR